MSDSLAPKPSARCLVHAIWPRSVDADRSAKLSPAGRSVHCDARPSGEPIRRAEPNHNSIATTRECSGASARDASVFVRRAVLDTPETAGVASPYQMAQVRYAAKPARKTVGT